MPAQPLDTPRAASPTRRVVVVALGLAVAFVLVRLVLAASLGGFAVASDDFVDPARTSPARGLRRREWFRGHYRDFCKIN